MLHGGAGSAAVAGVYTVQCIGISTDSSRTVKGSFIARMV